MMKSEHRMAGLDKPISELAIGTAFYRLDNKKLWFAILDDFFRSGGTLLDSGRGYGDSEEVIGLWMESRSARDKVVVTTKCGLTKKGTLPVENFEETVKEELTKSLQCLKTDYVDLYMLHRDNPLMPVARIMDCLNAELAGGRICALGASNWQYRRVDEANEYAYKHDMKGFAAISNNISLAVPSAPFWPGLVSVDQAGERWHAETGTPLIVWSAQARGFFTGRYTPQMRKEAGRIDDKFTAKMLEIYCTDENFERLRRAEELGGKKGGYSAVQVALAWLLQKPFPLVPIVGPHTREELTSCVDATSLELTEPEIKWLNLES